MTEKERRLQDQRDSLLAAIEEVVTLPWPGRFSHSKAATVAFKNLADVSERVKAAAGND